MNDGQRDRTDCMLQLHAQGNYSSLVILAVMTIPRRLGALLQSNNPLDLHCESCDTMYEKRNVHASLCLLITLSQVM